MHFASLNLPAYPFKCKQVNGKWYILDMLRKRFVRLTHEEWVRQNFVMYLIHERKFPPTLMTIEHAFELNGQTMRCDIAIFDSSGNILAVAECKSTEQKIDQNVFDQIFVYNRYLKARFLMVTNGLQHYCCKVDVSGRSSIVFLSEIPFYTDIR